MNEIEKLSRILKDHETRITQLEKLKKDKKHAHITSNKSMSTNHILLELKNDGFFKKPKNFGEIQKELERNGHYFNRTSLSKPLLMLVKRKQLGRVGEKGNWSYVAR